MDLELVRRLAVALALGLVLGVERGWRVRERAEGLGWVGLRTFALLGLLGGAAGALAEPLGPLLPAAALLATAGLAAVGYALTAPRSEDFGATTEVTALLTVALGVLAGTGRDLEALAAAAVAALLLRAKAPLHRSLARVERRELEATLQILVLAVVVIPLLPDRDLGPWESLNPRTIGLLVLLIAGISYVGYIAVHVLGPRRGLLLTALFGGLTSSTAVTISFSRMAQGLTAPNRWLAAGIGLAVATMAPRLWVEVFVVDPDVARALVVPLAALAVVPGAAAGLLAWRGDREAEPAELGLRNPLQLGTALAYGAALALLFLLARGLHAALGEPGIYLLALVSGTADVDAVGLSLAGMAGGEIPRGVAARGIALAALSNTAVKGGLALAVGGRRLARPALALFLPTLAAGALAILAMGCAGVGAG